VYLRCDRGRTNPLYPGEPCAPTIDDLRYETVGIDLAQPDRRGIDGIWVVNRWGTTEPFAQADPELAQADVEATLAELAQARVDGEGAEGHIGTFNSLGVQVRAPLLYATTSGARYERFEIERAHGPGWPDAFMQYVIRLFADGGDTVVEQPILAYGADELVHSAAATTENGQPVPITYEFFDGQVSVTAALPWVGDDFDHWSALKRTEQDAGQIYVIRDPWPTGHGCFSDARTADAKALAETIASDPDLVASTPVAVTLAGRPAWGTEVTLAPGVSCEHHPGSTRVLTYDPGQRVVWIDESSRIRLYLLDAPAGSSYGILAIAIKAPESRFESVVAEAMPILESIEFNLGGGLR
jgi:hypothetical protein